MSKFTDSERKLFGLNERDQAIFTLSSARPRLQRAARERECSEIADNIETAIAECPTVPLNFHFAARYTNEQSVADELIRRGVVRRTPYEERVEGAADLQMDPRWIENRTIRDES